MGELRKRYDEEAPLLFLAASPESNGACFAEVCRTLAKHLGVGGLLEQMNSKDMFGRTLRMHAARTRNHALYKKVNELLSVGQQKVWCIKENISGRDYRGCSLLHHAAEAGSPAIFEDVLEFTKRDGDYRKCFSWSDNRGRTPLMSILSQELKNKEDYDDREKKLTKLDETRDQDWSMAIVYAARGGWHSFILTLARMKDLGKPVGKCLQSLSEAVKTKGDKILPNYEPDQYTQLVEDVKQGIAACVKKEHTDSLLVQAALGGHTSVLDFIFEVRRNLIRAEVSRSCLIYYGETVRSQHLSSDELPTNVMLGI